MHDSPPMAAPSDRLPAPDLKYVRREPYLGATKMLGHVFRNTDMTQVRCRSVRKASRREQPWQGRDSRHNLSRSRQRAVPAGNPFIPAARG